MDVLEQRERRREQVVGAIYNGIGTGIGISIAGVILAIAGKLAGLV